jgi:hypothetical protein
MPPPSRAYYPGPIRRRNVGPGCLKCGLINPVALKIDDKLPLTRNPEQVAILWITLGMTGITPYCKTCFSNIGAESRRSNISSRHTEPVSSRCSLPCEHGPGLLPPTPNSPRRSGPRQLRQCDCGVAAGGTIFPNRPPTRRRLARGSFTWKAKLRKAAGIHLAFAIIAVTNPGRMSTFARQGVGATLPAMIPGRQRSNRRLRQRRLYRSRVHEKAPPGEGGASHGNR